MTRRTPHRALAALLSIGWLSVAGCVLTPAGIQLLELHFALSETLAAEQAAMVHQQVLHAEVGIKKHQVRVSGRITGATSLPERVDVLVTSEGVEDGKIYDRFRLKLKVGADGGFVATGKWKKNIKPATLQTVFLTPIGADLAGDLDLDVCVQIAKQKTTLNQVADCSSATGGGGASTFELVAAPHVNAAGFHELITIGGEFPESLPATAGMELVVSLRDESRPDQVCPEEIPWDGCASVDWDDHAGRRNTPPSGYFENRLALTTEDGPLQLFLNRHLALDRTLDDNFAID